MEDADDLGLEPFHRVHDLAAEAVELGVDDVCGLLDAVHRDLDLVFGPVREVSRQLVYVVFQILGDRADFRCALLDRVEHVVGSSC